MDSNVHDITLAITNIAALPNGAGVAAKQAKIGEARKKYGAAKKVLLAKVSGDKEKALLAVLDGALKDGAAKNNQVIQLRLSGKASEAMTYLVKETASNLQRVVDAIDAIVVYEDKMAVRAGAAAEAAYAGRNRRLGRPLAHHLGHHE
ncbi:hypothetical protein AAKU55_003662 [Oxalobacteraceae bacterium GrIS 1.11]